MLEPDERFEKYLRKEDEEEEDYGDAENGDAHSLGGSNASWDGEDVDGEVLSQSDCEYGQPTTRLAVVRCDWDHVRAADLFSILSHALPLGGTLHRVSIFTSEFGKTMLEREKRLGPDLWEDEKQDAGKSDEDDTEVDAEASPLKVKNDEEGGEDNDESSIDDGEQREGDEDDEPEAEFFTSAKYRQYELNRLKYYYAIAEFDSSDTAAAVYTELDGVELHANGVALDLRYVDEDETFDQSTAVTSADGIPMTFRPLTAYHHSASSNCRFRVSWDADDVFRAAAVMDAFGKGDADNDDEGKEDIDANIAAYLASDDDDDAAMANREAERAKYADLIALAKGTPPSSRDLPHADDFDDDHDDDASFDDDDELQEGEMRGTLRLDAMERAQALQTKLRREAALANADIGERGRLLRLQRRKEQQKADKRERVDAREAQEQSAGDGSRLVVQLGDVIEKPRSVLHAERREQRKQERREAAANLRRSRKLQRTASALQKGVETPLPLDPPLRKEGNLSKIASAAVDERFSSKLIGDARFHVDLHSLPPAQQRALAPMAAAVTTLQARTKASKRERGGDDSGEKQNLLSFFEQRKGRRRVQ